MYDSWDMEHNRQNFFLILDQVLPSPPPRHHFPLPP